MIATKFLLRNAENIVALVFGIITEILSPLCPEETQKKLSPLCLEEAQIKLSPLCPKEAQIKLSPVYLEEAQMNSNGSNCSTSLQHVHNFVSYTLWIAYDVFQLNMKHYFDAIYIKENPLLN